MEPKKKKISRKDVTELGMGDLWVETKSAVSKMTRYMRPYRGRFFLGVFLGILSGFFNIVLLVGMQIVLSVVLRGETSALSATEIPGYGVVDLGVLLGIKEDADLSAGQLVLVCSIIPLLFLARGLIGYLANYCMLWVGNKILYQMRNDCFQNVMKQSLGYFHRAKIGDLIQTVFNQARVAQNNAVGLATTLTQKPVAILAILIFLFAKMPREDWMIILSSLIILPLSIFPVIYIGKRVRKAGAAEEMEAGAIMTTMHESFMGIRVVKSYARESYEAKRFDRANSAMIQSIMRWGKASEVVGPIVETVAAVGIAAGLIYAKKRGLGAEDFFIVVLALTQIYEPAKALSRVQIILQKCIVATSAVFEMIEEVPEILDAPNAVSMGKVKGAISFKNLSFHYADPKGRRLERAAVTGVNLELEPGKFYALVGPSGAGKSTLFSLLLRFYDPEEGCIELDGVDLRQMTQASLRDNIGVVSQDTFLFHDTINENIRYGRLNASNEEIVEAAKKSHAHDFVSQMKDGYQSVVGDMGSNLSGGQKQRVSIARAILRNAPILLLDEATSALDTEAEMIIQEAIEVLSEGKTVIAIAHRLSTILEADQIVVMNAGKIEATGTHQELLVKCELYQRLYHLQYEKGNQPNVEESELAAVET